MGFKKGESGNPAGRPPGSRNRTPIEVQKRLLKLLDDNIDDLSDDIKSLKPKERANLLFNLAKHVTPAALNPERLTVEMLEQLIDYTKKQIEDEKIQSEK